MLAIHYESTKILEYLAKEIISKSKDPERCRKELLKTRKETSVGIQPLHLACFFGNLDILKIMHK